MLAVYGHDSITDSEYAAIYVGFFRTAYLRHTEATPHRKKAGQLDVRADNSFHHVLDWWELFYFFLLLRESGIDTHIRRVDIQHRDEQTVGVPYRFGRLRKRELIDMGLYHCRREFL